MVLLHDQLQADLASSEKKAHILTQFTDYLLTQNCERWRDSEPFLTTGESKTAWGAFFHSRPQSAVADKSKAKPKQDKPKLLHICWAYNSGNCQKVAGSCTTLKGLALKHICSFVKPVGKPHEVCGKDHPKLGYH